MTESQSEVYKLRHAISYASLKIDLHMYKIKQCILTDASGNASGKRVKEHREQIREQERLRAKLKEQLKALGA